MQFITYKNQTLLYFEVTEESSTDDFKRFLSAFNSSVGIAFAKCSLSIISRTRAISLPDSFTFSEPRSSITDNI
uniref:DUF2887 domain-containing protein n=1 Tax=Schistosoma curassoni TaxID=6186 RepID=A0A183L4B8_9TREM